VNKAIKPATEMTTDELVAFLQKANEAYRSGEPIIADDTYDQVYYKALQQREPNHPFLNAVEPEADVKSKKVRHETPMLSTDKAYTQEEITAYVNRVLKFAEKLKLPLDEIQFRITPKLDGMAARYNNDILATRGNGQLGNDITRNIARGLQTLGGDNTGNGEIVISKRYFEDNLSDQFSHPRNFVTGLIGADNLSPEAIEAMQDKVIRFVPYTQLNDELCNANTLSTQAEALCAKVENDCEYPVDGSVIDVMDEQIREAMGSTNHHHDRDGEYQKRLGSASLQQVQCESVPVVQLGL